MTTTSAKAKKSIEIMGGFQNTDELIQRIRDLYEKERKEVLPLKTDIIPSVDGQKRRLELLKSLTGVSFDHLTQQKVFDEYDLLQGNIENFIGMSQVPTGVIGPLRVLGSAAIGDFYVPLATSEGALVASYHRGAKAASLCGGITSLCLTEGVQRSPVFKFKNLGELGNFLIWTLDQQEEFKNIVSKVSRFAKLSEMKVNIEGNKLILIFEYYTGDAAGQNMVTLCTNEICNYILEHAPIKPDFWFLESNYSGDKKATALSFTNVRGKKVVAEVLLSNEVVKDVLKTTPQKMAEYWQTSTISVIQSGSIGAQGHFANGLAALFIATGQDAACVTEAAIGITRMERTPEDNLYISVTLPNLIVGTVGGGTALPTQKECLELMGCFGTGKARKYAEICGALVLAGEISIAAALSAGHFSKAHQKLGRKRK